MTTGVGKQHGTIPGRQTDDLLRALAEHRLADVDLSSEALPAREWEGETRLRQIAGLIESATRAYKAGEAPGSVTWPLIADVEREQPRWSASGPRQHPRRAWPRRTRSRASTSTGIAPSWKR